ncbi:HoxN/HupN/NixA family nickel/cobalt transporter [Nocardia sp. NPDC059240]|uniref:HoxN/HupN/NixA family nickel/cobalt transporter n=1 Tax=Nocardia sp. NPDC059240 TaxID=3346786 RepID=UPI003693630E
MSIVSGGGRAGRRDWSVRSQTAGLVAVVGSLHLAAWGLLIFAVLPHHYVVGTQIFGVGLGLTAYTLGLRHAFDADHIAAIDNTTRKLMTDGKRPVSVGLWFALGHSTVVAVLAALLSLGVHVTNTLLDDNSSTRATLGTIGTLLAGTFLYAIAILNLVALRSITKTWRQLRRGQFDAVELDKILASRGFVNRLLSGLTRSISRPGQMFAVGLLFGIGFDTATEVALLVLAGNGAAGGLPWYAILVVPLLFAAGMALLDTLDGAFMAVAYRWAFANPARKIFYNATITGLSVAVALLIGTIELVGVLHDDLELGDPITTAISGLNLNNVGFAIVGLFVVIWAVAIGYWRLTDAEGRIDTRLGASESADVTNQAAASPFPGHPAVKI